MFRKIFDYFIFSSLYISCCSVLMVYQTMQLIPYRGNINPLYGFLFFSTLCSYNAHWYFTPFSKNERQRSYWSQQHRHLQLSLSIAGAVGALCFLPFFLDGILWLLPSVVLTFLYTAPKTPFPLFRGLKKIAIGKTLYLTIVWTYVTTVLPVLLYEVEWTGKQTIFTVSRFFIIYPICILFDYRDREQDKLDGIKSLVTYFGEKGINILFFFSVAMFIFSTVYLRSFGVNNSLVALLISPGILLLVLFPIARKRFSDYLYYFVLDGLMMFSALCMLLLSI